MPSQQRTPPAGGNRNVGGGNVQPGPGAGEVEVLGTAVVVVVVDTAAAAADDDASLGWSCMGHEGNSDLLLGELVLL